MSKVNKKRKFIALGVIVLVVIALAAWWLSRHTIAVLEPAGEVGDRERNLIIVAALLSVIVVIPVYTMTIIIAWKYRAGNKKAKYSPDWDHSRLFESLWWAIPIVIIGVLSIITWDSTHSLNPSSPLTNVKHSMVVDVVALDWKWLFIYPSQHIASVNLTEFPKDTDIDFNITSDTVMNSFWVPQLGGQIYAMPGMSTQMNLEANRFGSFNGWSANISGAGFSHMMFTAKSVSQATFAQWVKTAQKTPQPLTMANYNKLAKPTKGYPVTLYSQPANGLYTDIIMKYMSPVLGGANKQTTNQSQATSGSMQGMYMQ